MIIKNQKKIVWFVAVIVDFAKSTIYTYTRCTKITDDENAARLDTVISLRKSLLEFQPKNSVEWYFDCTHIDRTDQTT